MLYTKCIKMISLLQYFVAKPLYEANQVKESKDRPYARNTIVTSNLNVLATLYFENISNKLKMILILQRISLSFGYALVSAEVLIWII